MAIATSAHTAREARICHEHNHGGPAHVIAPGHRYLRLVLFPGDINTSGRPWVNNKCIACANRYDATRGTVEGGACSANCCVFTTHNSPCALPLGHEGDHSCLRCAAKSEKTVA